MKLLPRVLTEEECKAWGLPEIIPVFPPQKILDIEAKYFKKELQQMCLEYFLDPRGDKQLLIEKLLYIGAIDETGERTGLPAKKPTEVPYVIGPPKQFCCRICGECCPKNLLKDGLFLERMIWLRQHYKQSHPGKWGNPITKEDAVEFTPSTVVVPKTGEVWYMGEAWEYEYDSDGCAIYRSKDGKKRLYYHADGTKEIKPFAESRAKFPTGTLVMSRGVFALTDKDPKFYNFVLQCLTRHSIGDWGNLCEEDKKENEYALNRHLRLFSAYEEGGFPKIWVITEADRSITTVLFPEEY